MMNDQEGAQVLNSFITKNKLLFFRVQFHDGTSRHITEKVEPYR